MTALFILSIFGSSGIRLRVSRVHIVAVSLRIVVVMRRAVASAASTTSSPIGLIRKVAWVERKRSVRRVLTAEWERRRRVGVIYTGAWLTRRGAIGIESAVERMENIPGVVIMGCHDDGCVLLFEVSCERNKVK